MKNEILIFENEEISFVFIKATEGENFIDKQYKNNRKEVEKTSIIRGYYHFFRFNKNGKKQAEFFIQNVPYKIGELYPCVDIETYGNKFHNKSKNEIIADIDLYIKTIKNYKKQKIYLLALSYTLLSRFTTMFPKTALEYLFSFL